MTPSGLDSFWVWFSTWTTALLIAVACLLSLSASRNALPGPNSSIAARRAFSAASASAFAFASASAFNSAASSRSFHHFQ